MVTTTNKQYKIVCERCGKKEYADDKPENHLKPLDMGYHEISFGDEVRTVAKGGVCRECYKEFRELAENFFDEVNKENEGRPAKKPDAIFVGVSKLFGASNYKCPLCGGTFNDLIVDKKDVRCPDCKAELGDIK